MMSKEEKEWKFKLVQCSVQGQCLRWESVVIEMEIICKDIWDWSTARITFLIKATYDILASLANVK